MSSAALPNLDQLPSVLETHEVDAVLDQAIKAAESDSALSAQDIIDCVVDAIFARGYRPGEHFDPAISGRIFEWIKIHWDAGTPGFVDAASTALANLNHADINPFLELLLATENREFAREAIRECHAERTKSKQDGGGDSGALRALP